VKERIYRAVDLAAKIGRAQPIVHFFAFPARHDQSRALEKAKMMRDRGARHTDEPGYTRHALFAVAKQPKDLQPRPVAELRERFRHRDAILGARQRRFELFVIVSVRMIHFRSPPIVDSDDRECAP